MGIPEQEERRQAERFSLCVDVKFLLRGGVEGSGVLLDISETGLALLCDIAAEEGDPIIVYPIGLGRMEGKVVRHFDGGFGVVFLMSENQRESVRTRIEAALAGRPYMRLVEKRSDLRIRYNIETMAWLKGVDEPIACTIVDMSRSGCLLHAVTKPAQGTEILVGALKGVVTRHVEEGFAVEFIAPLKQSKEEPKSRHVEHAA